MLHKINEVLQECQLHNYSEVSFQDLELDSELGKGASGTVYKAKWQSNTVAVKMMSDYTDFINELVGLSALNHPNIIRMFGYGSKYPEDTSETNGENNKNLYLIFEYAHRGSLSNYIENNPAPSFNLLINFAFQLANAVDYIHTKNILHADIKIQNILLSYLDNIILCDFNCSGTADCFENNKIVCGTFAYLPPEIKPYSTRVTKGYNTFKSDIYSLMLTIVEILEWEISNRPSIKNFISDFSEPLKKIIPSELNKLLWNGMDKTPDKRPSAKVISTTLGSIKQSALISPEKESDFKERKHKKWLRNRAKKTNFEYSINWNIFNENKENNDSQLSDNMNQSDIESQDKNEFKLK